MKRSSHISSRDNCHGPRRPQQAMNSSLGTVKGRGAIGSVLGREKTDMGILHASSGSRSLPDRRDIDGSWVHDKYEFRFSSEASPERTVTGSDNRRNSDYRPPSPRWVSRAGGVAIMKGRSDSSKRP